MRWFSSYKQGSAAVLGALTTVVGITADWAAPWGWAWQAIALTGFVGFVITMIWRLSQLTASPMRGEIKWARQQADMMPFTLNYVAENNVAYNATVAGRIWAVGTVTLDAFGVRFERSRLPRWVPGSLRRLGPKARCADGEIGSGWEDRFGEISGKKLAAGEQIVLDRRLFSVWADSPSGLSTSSVYPCFFVRMRAPDQTVSFKIAPE